MKNNLNASILTSVIIARGEATVGDILNKIKSDHFEYLNQIFVTDRDKHLIGSVELSSLLTHDPSTRLEQIACPSYPIDNTLSLEYAANHAISKGISAVPVVNEKAVLMGVLPEQTIIETLRKEHIDDIHKIAGIRKEITNARIAITEPPTKSVWHRLPWLLVGLSGSIFATFIISRYESVLGNNISLTFFIPGIVYLADAIGTQTETIVIRGLSLSWATFRQILKKEFFTGALIGLAFGLLSFAVILLTGFTITIAITVATSIFAAGMVATTIGLFLPFLLTKFGKDPAYGSGPLATVVQDIMGIIIYLMIAEALFFPLN